MCPAEDSVVRSVLFNGKLANVFEIMLLMSVTWGFLVLGITGVALHFLSSSWLESVPWGFFGS